MNKGFKFISRLIVGIALIIISGVMVWNIFNTIVVPKLPPLSKVPDTYAIEHKQAEEIPEGTSSFAYGLQLALNKAGNLKNIYHGYMFFNRKG